MGLLRGRSRKRFDPFEARTGEVVKSERHDAVLSSGTITTLGAGTTDTTILAVPTGQTARLLEVNTRTNSATANRYRVLMDGTRLLFADVAALPFTTTEKYQYEDAPRANGTISISFDTGGIASLDWVIRYTLEPASGGYLVGR